MGRGASCSTTGSTGELAETPAAPVTSTARFVASESYTQRMNTSARRILRQAKQAPRRPDLANGWAGLARSTSGIVLRTSREQRRRQRRPDAAKSGRPDLN